MAIAHVNGINIWYEENGAGDPVIQLHGSGFGHQNFAAATPRLAKHFRVIDFDLRGYGQSDQPIQHYDMEVWADDTAGLMDALSIAKAHIHGTSMGANIAQQFAAKYSDRVDRLILNCGAAKLDAASFHSSRTMYKSGILPSNAFRSALQSRYAPSSLVTPPPYSAQCPQTSRFFTGVL